MAVLQMQRISICALKKDRKSILETLQRRGVVEISDLALQDSVFEKADTSAVRSQFEKDLSAVNQALEVLDAYSPVKSSLLSSLEGRGPLTADEYAAFGERADDVLAQALRLNALSKKISENRAEILKLETQLDALVPWLGLDVPLRFTGTRSTAAFIGSFPEDLSLDEVYSRIAGQAPDATVNVDLVSHSQDQTCVFIVAPRAEAAAVDEALRAIGFTRPASPPAESPAERKKLLEAETARANEAIEAARTEIVSRGGDRPDLKLLADYLRLRAEKYDVIGRLMQSRRAFILSGYVTARNARPLSEELSSKFDVAVELTGSRPRRGRAGRAQEQPLLHPGRIGRRELQPPRQARDRPDDHHVLLLLHPLRHDAFRRGLRPRHDDRLRGRDPQVQEHGARHRQDGQDVLLVRAVHHLLGIHVRQLLRGRGRGHLVDLLPQRPGAAAHLVRAGQRAHPPADLLLPHRHHPPLRRAGAQVLPVRAGGEILRRGLRRRVLVPAGSGRAASSIC